MSARASGGTDRRPPADLRPDDAGSGFSVALVASSASAKRVKTLRRSGRARSGIRPPVRRGRAKSPRAPRLTHRDDADRREFDRSRRGSRLRSSANAPKAFPVAADRFPQRDRLRELSCSASSSCPPTDGCDPVTEVTDELVPVGHGPGPPGGRDRRVPSRTGAAVFRPTCEVCSAGVRVDTSLARS